MNITDFKTALSNLNGPAPVNRFHVYIDGGPDINFRNVKNELYLMCESAELPGKNLMTYEDKLYGPVRKIPYAMSFTETTMTFLCTNGGLREKRFFDEWQNLIVNNESSDVSYYDDYKANIKLQLFDEFNNLNFEVIFLEAYPLTVSPITLTQNPSTDYAKITVSFSYRRWTEDIKTKEKILTTTTDVVVTAP
jgi:hypothetical protein